MKDRFKELSTQCMKELTEVFERMDDSNVTSSPSTLLAFVNFRDSALTPVAANVRSKETAVAITTLEFFFWQQDVRDLQQSLLQ